MPTLRRNRFVLILFVVLGALPIYRALFFGEAIGAFDQIVGMGWVPNAPTPTTAWDILQADSVLQFYVWRDLVLQAWGHGQPALWNPYALCGTPLLANSQSAVFYPPHIILGVLHIPVAFSMALLAWFHLSLAGLGVAWLSRQFGAGRMGAITGGAAFTLSAFMVAWTALPSVISTVAWIPFVLAFGLKCLRTEPHAKRHLDGLGLAVSTGMMILAGHLQFVAYGLMGLLVIVVASAVVERRWKSAWRPVVGVVLGVCLAAPQLLPVLSYSKFSHRQNTPSESGYGDYIAGAIQPFELVGVIFPELVGNPQQPLGVQQDPGTSSYWPQYFKRGGNYAEGALGIGAIAMLGLAFLGFAVARKAADVRTTIAPLALGVISFLLAVGSPLNRLMYFAVPGWSASGSPGRICVLFVISMCVLAAIGWSKVDLSVGEGNAKYRPFFPILVLGAALGLSFAALGGLHLPFWFAKEPNQFSLNLFEAASQKTKIAALFEFTVVAAFTVFCIRDRFQRHWTVLLPFIVLTYSGFALGVRTGNVPPLNPALKAGFDRIAIVPGNWGLLERARTLLPPNLATLHRVHEVGGYDSLMHRDTVKLLHEIDGKDAAPPANGNMMFVDRKFDEKLLVAAGVSQIWSKPAGGNELQIQSLPGKRAEMEAPGTANIESEDLRSIVVSATGPGHLTLHDRNMPGWTVTIDGKPAALSGDLWRETDVPIGKHSVEFHYVPPGLTIGIILCVFAVFICVALGIGRPARIPATL